MSTLARTLLVSIALLLTVFVVLVLLPSDPGVIQPIAYNHQLHVEGEGLECIDCHLYVEELPRATLPDLEICLDCHDVEPFLEDSAEEAILIEYIKSGREIDWNRIYQVPDHVYFSHRRHVVAGDLDCSICHGDVALLTEPSPYPFVDLTMDACMDCHYEYGATNDCIACHK